MNIFIYILTAIFLILPVQAQAEIVKPYEVKLLQGWHTKENTYMTALQIQLAPDWKTYWRNPMGSGIAPTFNWTGSENIKSVSYKWPSPSIFNINDVTVIGYKTELILPIEIIPNFKSKPVNMNGTIQFGVCKDICVPANATISMQFNRNNFNKDPRILASLAKAPKNAESNGIARSKCELKPNAKGLEILVTTTTRKPMTGRLMAVIEADDPMVWIGRSQVNKSGKQIRSIAQIHSITGKAIMLDRSKLRITFIGDHGTIVMPACGSKN